MPALRFPEFRNTGDWGQKQLHEAALFVKEKIALEDISPENYVSTENLLQDFMGMEPSPNRPRNGSATKFRINDVLISNIRPYLKKIWVAEIEGGASNDVIVIREKNKLANKYLSQLLKSDPFIEYVMTGAKGVKMPRGDVELIKKFVVAIPKKPDEQQKIAACLSSLDDLIAAQARKIESLKAHKKGLMQLLFPAEDETLPKLRFPEFREAEEWEEKRLGDIGSVRMCKRILKEQTSPSGDIPFYKIGTFGGVADAYISLELFGSYRNNFPFPKNGAVLISAAGTIGRTVRYNGELAYFQDSNIVWLDNNENLIADNFLFYLYQLMKWAPSIGAIQRLYNDNILGATIKFPAIPEQQKIANCLSSLDDLITAQTQKLETLKTQKAGLMQGLFPSMAEAEA